MTKKKKRAPKIRYICHPFHLVDPSPWPFLASLAAFSLVLSAVSFIHGFQSGLRDLLLSLVFLTTIIFMWFRDVVREGTYFDLHNENVMKSIRMGFILFIVSEAMLFFSLFWAFFHSSLAPAISIGCVWPPYGMVVLSPWGLPFLNTSILLVSGATITWAHLAIFLQDNDDVMEGFMLTLYLAIAFLVVQAYEYIHAPFSLSDGIYGSVFFMLTGFHGFHVLIGTVFILVQFLRQKSSHFTPQEHFGFEACAWYWHFVDLVWLIVFATVYVWGNMTPF